MRSQNKRARQGTRGDTAARASEECDDHTPSDPSGKRSVSPHGYSDTHLRVAGLQRVSVLRHLEAALEVRGAVRHLQHLQLHQLASPRVLALPQLPRRHLADLQEGALHLLGQLPRLQLLAHTQVARLHLLRLQQLSGLLLVPLLRVVKHLLVLRAHEVEAAVEDSALVARDQQVLNLLLAQLQGGEGR